MTIPHSLVRAAHNAVLTDPTMKDPAAWRAQQAVQKRPQLRRYEISTLLANGNISETRHLAPALPLFEDAFCAFSRGSMVETEQGPIAIEDLLPGDRVLTSDDQYETVLWKGSTTLVPGRPGPSGRNLRLTRIMADSFGMQRPMSYVLAGPSARLLNTPDHLRSMVGGAQMLTPVQEFIDGMNVIETAPPSPVDLYHICLPRHAAIRVGGLEFETYHPGTTAVRMISHAMRSLYLNLFAHIDHLTDFGPLAFPRSGDGLPDAMSA